LPKPDVWRIAVERRHTDGSDLFRRVRFSPIVTQFGGDLRAGTQPEKEEE
jgi:hypothetical protein